MTDASALEMAADEIVDQIRPFLAGKPPALQGLVVAELAAILIAGFPPQDRDEAMTLELNLIRNLVPLWAERIRPELRRRKHDA